jgi:hypothetical protein
MELFRVRIPQFTFPNTFTTGKLHSCIPDCRALLLPVFVIGDSWKGANGERFLHAMPAARLSFMTVLGMPFPEYRRMKASSAKLSEGKSQCRPQSFPSAPVPSLL